MIALICCNVINRRCWDRNIIETTKQYVSKEWRDIVQEVKWMHRSLLLEIVTRGYNTSLLYYCIGIKNKPLYFLQSSAPSQLHLMTWAPHRDDYEDLCIEQLASSSNASHSHSEIDGSNLGRDNFRLMLSIAFLSTGYRLKINHDLVLSYPLHIYHPTIRYWSWDSLDGLKAGGPGFDYRQCKIFLLSTASRTALGPIQHSIQSLPGSSFPGGTGAGWWSWLLTSI
jgi:hypothetical protein